MPHGRKPLSCRIFRPARQLSADRSTGIQSSASARFPSSVSRTRRISGPGLDAYGFAGFWSERASMRSSSSRPMPRMNSAMAGFGPSWMSGTRAFLPTTRNAFFSTKPAALETLGADSELQQACADALNGWERLVLDKLLGCGFPADDARELATTVISAIEGAEVTAQVNRSEEPLLAAGRQLARLIRSYGIEAARR
ncbi:hypothetical protein GA0115280_108728 [Streptomyces sp. Cmuel-A718b]|nr:hypothetical protein GA0115280_108728 [Streptomyces sp. Cmuel-A718b]